MVDMEKNTEPLDKHIIMINLFTRGFISFIEPLEVKNSVFKANSKIFLTKPDFATESFWLLH